MTSLDDARRVTPSATPTAKGIRTKRAILDAAERCFAERGFDGVSMRLVAEQAPVLIGLLTYHFATKEALFSAVIARRAKLLNDRRAAAMLAAPSNDLTALLDAFIRPYLDLMETGEPGWRAYAQVIAVTSQEGRWADLAETHFGPTARMFIERLKPALPGLDDDSAVRAYVHTVSVVMGMFAETGLIDRFSNGRLRSDDLRAGFETAVKFLAGGIRAIARQPDLSGSPRF